MDNISVLLHKADAEIIAAKQLLGEEHAPFAKLSFFGTATQLLEYTKLLCQVYEPSRVYTMLL